MHQIRVNPLFPRPSAACFRLLYLSGQRPSAHTGAVKILDDTEPEVRRMILDANRHATTGERLERACNLTDLVRELAVGVLRSEHPDATELEWRRLLARRFLDRDLAMAVIADLDRRGL